MNPYLAKLQALEQMGPAEGFVSFVGIQNRPISEFENSKIATSANRQNRQNLFCPAFEALKRQCPAHVDVADWQMAIEDGGSFLRRWAEQAEALGWTARDLFGLAPAPDKSRELPAPQQIRLNWADLVATRAARGGTHGGYGRYAAPARIGHNLS
jgi:hypothetical protein